MQAITTKFRRLGGEAGVLGKPKGVVQPSADKVGGFRLFENGAIYFHPVHGAFAVQGAMYKEWVKAGGERGALGYPVSDQRVSGDGSTQCSCFQNGRIYQRADKVWTTDLTSDAAEVAWGIFQATPLPFDWLDQYKDFDKLPASIDYEGDIDFARNQGIKPSGWGGYGCMTYGLLHIIDILKDWEHPYTPAVSFGFADWYHTEVFYVAHGHFADLYDLGVHGFATEGMYHTNFDTNYWRTTGSNGEVTSHWAEASQAAKNEVILYRVNIARPENQHSCGSDTDKAVEEIKQVLRAYGPVWCTGNGHARAIIGYDDDTQKFKILDSYPHTETGGHNITSLGYQDVGPGKNINTFAEVTNISNAARTTGRYAYSARIAIDNCWRGTYNVYIGVEGRERLLVWSTRGRDVHDLTPLEHGKFLCIDIPLPDYAAECWPPSASHRWFLEVEDCDRDGAQGTITEFTLARRYIHPNCQSVGKYRTQTYGGAVSVAIPNPSSGSSAPTPPTNPGDNPDWPSETPNPNPGTVRVNIPAANGGPIVGVSTAVLKLSLTLPANQVVINGNQVTLKGKFKNVALNTPMAGKKVRLCRVKHNTCVNKPAVWQKVSEVQTDSNGGFSFQMTLTEYKAHMYAAAYYSGDEVLASSAPLVFDKIIVHDDLGNTVGKCRLVEKKYWAKTLPKFVPVDVRELMYPLVKIPNI